MRPRRRPPRRLNLVAIEGLARLGLGQREQAASLLAGLERMQPLPVGALARWQAAAGSRDEALRLLEAAVAAGPVAFQPLMSDPAFDGLRSDPRFTRLLTRVSP